MIDRIARAVDRSTARERNEKQDPDNIQDNQTLLCLYTMQKTLPRPVFNMASGTTFTSNTKVENETSPIFPARVEIIQGGGFEKPQIIQPQGSRSDTCRFHGARGAARGRYLNAGL